MFDGIKAPKPQADLRRDTATAASKASTKDYNFRGADTFTAAASSPRWSGPDMDSSRFRSGSATASIGPGAFSMGIAKSSFFERVQS